MRPAGTGPIPPSRYREQRLLFLRPGIVVLAVIGNAGSLSNRPSGPSPHLITHNHNTHPDLCPGVCSNSHSTLNLCVATLRRAISRVRPSRKRPAHAITSTTRQKNQGKAGPQ